MRKYRVWDIEAEKERTLHNCITNLGEVGDVRKVNIRNKAGVLEEHHFKVLEVLHND